MQVRQMKEQASTLPEIRVMQQAFTEGAREIESISYGGCWWWVEEKREEEKREDVPSMQN